ncbi:hypothetical protein C9426_00850 [Serratia sp. S1B]|nr:hypothetical protein C9426_00850 [Serratia sp. S1B]
MNKHKIPLTPCINSNSVQFLLKKINTTNSPLYVKSSPLQNSIENECFPIVEEYVQQNGGERILGWAIWELPNLFIEAEFHAVWKSPKQELIDLNPRPVKTEKILFLPDPKLIYDGYQKNNIRLPLINNPIVSNFLAMHDKNFEFMNRGDRKGQYGKIHLSDRDAYEYALLAQEMMEIEIQMNNIYKPLGLYDPCICGSGKKAKWCHKLK